MPTWAKLRHLCVKCLCAKLMRTRLNQQIETIVYAIYFYLQFFHTCSCLSIIVGFDLNLHYYSLTNLVNTTLIYIGIEFYRFDDKKIFLQLKKCKGTYLILFNL